MSFKDWAEVAGFVVAAIVSLGGAYISVRNRKVNVRSVEAKTNLDETQQASIVKEISESSEEKFRGEIADLRREIESLKLYINRHIPWDWKAVRELRLQGIDIEDPPSLQYIEGEIK